MTDNKPHPGQTLESAFGLRLPSALSRPRPIPEKDFVLLGAAVRCAVKRPLAVPASHRLVSRKESSLRRVDAA